MITVRGLNIGQGAPKIGLPITEKTTEAIMAQAEKFKTLPYDMVEWRADWFDGWKDRERITETIALLRKSIGEKPLLFTLRTQAEGGRIIPSPQEYIQSNLWALDAGADFIDCQLSTGEKAMTNLIHEAHRRKCFVIGSFHDFEKTPQEGIIKARLAAMEKTGCDIVKIAVMPQSSRDVLTLLQATEEMHHILSCPLIAISMGGLGQISRLCGEIFGSSITFGAGENTSAPGQMEAGMLSRILTVLHQSLIS